MHFGLLADRDFEVANGRVMQHVTNMVGEYKSRMEDDRYLRRSFGTSVLKEKEGNNELKLVDEIRSSVPDNLLSRMILASQTEKNAPETCPISQPSSRLKLTDNEVVSNTNLFLFGKWNHVQKLRCFLGGS